MLRAYITLNICVSVNCSVEHVILNVACSLEDEDTVNVEKYCLRVWGLAEYLAPNTTLAQYEYVHQCIKLEKDIELAIINRAQIKQSIARTVSIISSVLCKSFELFKHTLTLIWCFVLSCRMIIAISV